MNIITLNNISKSYGKKELEFLALKNINLQIKKGELIAIMGPSGSGKSTLLNIIATLDNSSSGNYKFNDIDVSTLKSKELAKFRNESVGFILQNFALINDYTVYDNIKIPLDYGKKSRKFIHKKIDEVASKLSIKELLKKSPKELSGGQCQRVAIARALVTDPDIILADEPTGSLDSVNGQAVIDILKDLNSLSKTVIIVTHDLKVAEQCQRIIRIKDGSLCTNS